MSTATVSSSAEAGAAPGALAAWFRLTALLLWLGPGTLVAAAGMLVLGPFRVYQARWRRAMFRRLARGTAWIVGLTIEVEGPAPIAPFLLACNHLSYLDIVTLAAVGPARFVAKREVRDWPGLGFLAHTLGTIFIDRTVKRDALRVLDRMAAALGQGDGIILFAEATSSGGERVLPFRPALLAWAAAQGHPVHAASLSYRVAPGAPPAARSVCWWGNMAFGPHLLGLCRLGRLGATVRYSPEPITERDRKRLARRLHGAVAATFTPMGTEQE